MIEEAKVILSASRFAIMIDRLCYQLIEQYDFESRICIIGIQPRGVLFANRLTQRLRQLEPNFKFDLGILDITFYRDDFRRHQEPLAPNRTDINFQMEDRPVIMIDDVLYTGRTIQAAMAAIQDFGRPSSLELMVLVDRRFNRHLPIQPDYYGIVVDALDEAYVQTSWAEDSERDEVVLYSSKSKAYLNG